MKLKRFLTVAIVAVMSLGMFSLNVANAAGTYKISCKNDAYGMQLGSDYTQRAYVYDASDSRAITSSGVSGVGTNNSYLITEYDQAYVGNDCLYAGSADTNGTAVVAGDVARLAINAIVGAVNNRIDMAYAAQNSGASATGVSFSTQADGVSMSANNIISGIGFWADYGSTEVKNTQKFTNVRVDSNKYDGDATAYSVGVDKSFGKALVGVVISSIDTNFTTTFNDGTYKQKIDTYGIYLAYRTNILQIDLGYGLGDSDIDTTRRDLGNDLVIVGKTTADIDYGNARISANYSRGRFSIVPSVSYRTMNMDIKAFTDDRKNDTSATVGDGLLFSSGNSTLTVTDDSISARRIETETMAFGINLSANYEKVVPYLGVQYESESTTSAAYKVEAGTDELKGTTADPDKAASSYNSSVKVGGGINFNLNSYIKGGLRVGKVIARDDWEETYWGGNISLGF